MTEGYLTTHVLDTSRGRPAEGVEIVLFALDGETRRRLGAHVTNADGRTDAPVLPRDAFAPGEYELVFSVRRYFESAGVASPFLDTIPLRFTMTEDAHYHVPLLLSPFGYSTYRGS